MRTLLFLDLLLSASPLVGALVSLDAYAGADPIAPVDTWPDPYRADTRMACVLPMTLQVQRNAGGTWDILARGVDAVPSPFAIVGEPGIAGSSATNCLTFLAPTLSITNFAGSPSTGLSKTIAATTCYHESVQVSLSLSAGPLPSSTRTRIRAPATAPATRSPCASWHARWGDGAEHDPRVGGGVAGASRSAAERGV